MAKAKIHTTFAAAHAVGACVESYKKMAKALGGIENYGRDKPFTLTQVLNVLGLDDALWVLDECAMGADAHRIKHEYRADCAARVLKVFEKERPTDSRPRDAIKASRDYGADRIDDTAMAAAIAAAIAAAAAAIAAAWDAGDARDAARVATMAAAGDAAGDARAAAMAAARAAAGDAAGDAWAAMAAARAAAIAAAGDAAGDAMVAAMTAANIEHNWQKKKLRAYLDGTAKPVRLPPKRKPPPHHCGFGSLGRWPRAAASSHQ